jgi:acetyl-CoA carboxylase carboxyl transferase subunit beta
VPNPLYDVAPFVDAFEPWEGPVRGVTAGDPLGFPGYADALDAARSSAGIDEAVITGLGRLSVGGGAELSVAVASFVFDVVGGSMGAAVGERVVRLYDRARRERLPVLVVTRSGGARMQEGMVSLVQMARTADAARRHADAGLLQVAYLRSPTTGGVYASFASLADVVLAEPGATVGFAGPRVAEAVTGAPLPEGAHTSESAAAAGLVDAVLEPHAARGLIATLLETAHLAGHPHADARRETIEGRAAAGAPPPSPVSAWDEVLAARDPNRPSGRSWLDRFVPHRVELCGDRMGGVDPVVVAALGVTAARTPVVAIALDRHSGTGRPRAAGFRTAQRAIRLAARLAVPVVTFVDTPGAEPSHESEQAGIAGEIARTFALLAAHPVATACLVVGEGGSGGALALACTDGLYMLPGSVFSVIGPEGAASILHRDPTRAPEVAAQLRLTGPDLVDLGIIDAVVPDDVAAPAIEAALGATHAGDGRARFDRATERWLT